MTTKGPDRDFQALRELYTASDRLRRAVTFEQFVQDPGSYLKGMVGQFALGLGAQAAGGATDSGLIGQRPRAQAGVVLDLQAMREQRQAKLDHAATPGEDDRGLEFWIED